MKITYIETYSTDGVQMLGSDFTSVCKELRTQRKLTNAINRHIKRLENLTNIHTWLKSGYLIRYKSEYR